MYYIRMDAFKRIVYGSGMLNESLFQTFSLHSIDVMIGNNNIINFTSISKYLHPWNIFAQFCIEYK